MEATEQRYEGSCVCGDVRFQVTTAPLIVHCCHCSWCQRETGSAFALNALIESDRVELLYGVPEPVDTPSNSGKGQTILRCPGCKVALWSHYAGAGDKLKFVRVGVLNEAHRFEPDVHIFTESKQPWVAIPEGAKAYAGYYPAKDVWSEASQARRNALFEK